jgi:glucokinase
LGIKTWLINDANAAALGEHHLGVGKGIANLIYVALGTGIGGAIILGGKLYTGAGGSAGEMGHMTIDVNGLRCKCGNIGCWETLASGTAVAREAVLRIRRGESSSLTELVSNIESITAREVFMAAKNGDYLAQDVINKTATYLGVGLVNLVNIFNPDMVIIGGGVARMGNLLLDPARQVVEKRAFPVAALTVRIVPTQLGGDAGVLGAAIFAFRQ